MEPTELGYIAGVIDVMGCLRVRHVGETELPSITISSPNEDLLKYLGKVTGTRAFIVKRSYNRRNCAEHCQQAHAHVVSMGYRWNVTGVRATMILEAITPYMALQRDEAEHLLAVGLIAPHKRATITKMEAKGWPRPLRWDTEDVVA